MKHTWKVGVLLLVFASGLLCGYWLGLPNSPIVTQDDVLKQYQFVRDKFDFTDAQMETVRLQLPTFMESMNRQDEWATVYALRVIALLDKDDAEGAARFMATVAANYHSRFSDGRGDLDLITRIEEMRAEHPVLDAALNEVEKGEGQE